ncbi:MAG: ABC transporter ATP-binding protein [Kiritimatiellae bacterium]|nr:ABC transporter ATP-binding protein [Kiritimatiellia bacterium]
MAVAVHITELSKRFGKLAAVDRVSVAIEPGELFFLLGPSGCGKTTLLRCVAGFHQPESGHIHIGDREVTDLPPHRRDTGMVFQSYALWPHLSVAENVAFGLRMRRVPRPEIGRRVDEALARVHMSDRANAKPNQLSGGQQQRVALARALVIEPQCLLLDEPLSNLDAKLRLEMRVEIRRICKQAGLTAIYVTHDQKEALSVADRLAVMQSGRIEQIGTPMEVYRRPANRFVAGFIGEGNFLEGHVAAATGSRLLVETAIGRLEALSPVHAPAAGSAVTVCIRPEAVRLDAPPGGAVNVLDGRLRHTVYQGEVAQHEFAVPGGAEEVTLKVFELNPTAAQDAMGQPRRIWVAPDNVAVV